jgi:hypothetical protein
VVALIGPWLGFMSFNPLYEQIDCECAGAPVRTPEPENGTPGVPGGPMTSPAKALLALRAVTIAAPIAAATFLRMWVLPFLVVDAR